MYSSDESRKNRLADEMSICDPDVKRLYVMRPYQSPYINQPIVRKLQYGFVGGVRVYDAVLANKDVRVHEVAVWSALDISKEASSFWNSIDQIAGVEHHYLLPTYGGFTSAEGATLMFGVVTDALPQPSKSFAELLKLTTPSPARKIKVLSQLASIMRYIHTHNAVVGSLSYDDILIDLVGDVKLNMAGPLLRSFVSGQSCVPHAFAATVPAEPALKQGLGAVSPWDKTAAAQFAYRQALESASARAASSLPSGPGVGVGLGGQGAVGVQSKPGTWETDVFAFGCLALRILSGGRLQGPPWAPSSTTSTAGGAAAGRYTLGSIPTSIADRCLPLTPPPGASLYKSKAQPGQPGSSAGQTGLPCALPGYDTLWLTSSLPAETRGAVSNVLIACVHPQPEQRPTMAEVDHVLLASFLGQPRTGLALRSAHAGSPGRTFPQQLLTESEAARKWAPVIMGGPGGPPSWRDLQVKELQRLIEHRHTEMTELESMKVEVNGMDELMRLFRQALLAARRQAEALAEQEGAVVRAQHRAAQELAQEMVELNRQAMEYQLAMRDAGLEQDIQAQLERQMEAVMTRLLGGQGGQAPAGTQQGGHTTTTSTHSQQQQEQPEQQEEEERGRPGSHTTTAAPVSPPSTSRGSRSRHGEAAGAAGYVTTRAAPTLSSASAGATADAFTTPPRPSHRGMQRPDAVHDAGEEGGRVSEGSSVAGGPSPPGKASTGPGIGQGGLGMLPNQTPLLHRLHSRPELARMANGAAVKFADAVGRLMQVNTAVGGHAANSSGSAMPSPAGPHDGAALPPLAAAELQHATSSSSASASFTGVMPTTAAAEVRYVINPETGKRMKLVKKVKTGRSAAAATAAPRAVVPAATAALGQGYGQGVARDRPHAVASELGSAELAHGPVQAQAVTTSVPPPVTAPSGGRVRPAPSPPAPARLQPSSGNSKAAHAQAEAQSSDERSSRGAEPAGMLAGHLPSLLHGVFGKAAAQVGLTLEDLAAPTDAEYGQ